MHVMRTTIEGRRHLFRASSAQFAPPPAGDPWATLPVMRSQALLCPLRGARLRTSGSGCLSRTGVRRAPSVESTGGIRMGAYSAAPPARLASRFADRGAMIRNGLADHGRGC